MADLVGPPKEMPKPGDSIIRETPNAIIQYYTVFAVEGDKIQVWSVGRESPGPMGPWSEWVEAGWKVGPPPKRTTTYNPEYAEHLGIAHGRMMERARLARRLRAIVSSAKGKSFPAQDNLTLVWLADALDRNAPELR